MKGPKRFDGVGREGFVDQVAQTGVVWRIGVEHRGNLARGHSPRAFEHFDSIVVRENRIPVIDAEGGIAGYLVPECKVPR
jgi:hypothetical protein